jgi:hypothetical protein
MNIKELIIKNNPNAPKDSKRLIAFFIMEDGKTKRKKFGQYQSGGTFFDGATEEKKNAYLARHRARENWDDIMSAGALSRWILWQDTNRSKLEKLINRKFGIKKVKIQITKQ